VTTNGEKKFDNMYNCFDKLRRVDRETDRQTDRRLATA